MTEAAEIVDQLINTEGIHPFVLISEAADRYLPVVDSLGVALENGKIAKVTEMDRTVAQKVDETKKTLRREDRITWALRFYRKALIEQLLWMVKFEPEYFQKKFKSPPAAEQPALVKQLNRMSDVDITPFQEYDPQDPDTEDSPYSGFSVIDTINERLGHFIKAADTYGAQEHGNIIHTLRLNRESFGEVVAAYRRGEIQLLRKYAGSRHIWPANNPSYDLQDKCGGIRTLIKFPNGWRWLNLLRAKGGEHMDDPEAPSHMAVTGHCANRFANGEYSLELVEPLGGDRWRHHAFFVVHKNGIMGEMKGRKNQKPSPRLHKYILELLRQYKEIKGFGGNPEGWKPENDFTFSDLPEPYQDIIKRERPELYARLTGKTTPED